MIGLKHILQRHELWQNGMLDEIVGYRYRRRRRVLVRDARYVSPPC